MGGYPGGASCVSETGSASAPRPLPRHRVAYLLLKLIILDTEIGQLTLQLGDSVANLTLRGHELGTLCSEGRRSLTGLGIEL